MGMFTEHVDNLSRLKTLKVKRLRPEAKLPKRAFDSAGYDLWSTQSGIIRPGERVQVPLGFSTEFDPGYVAVIDDRGSVGNAGVTHLAGVIDADYRGEWILIMCNVGGEAFSYNTERAIAQVLFHKIEEPEVVEVEELSKTDREGGRLGSSGH